MSNWSFSYDGGVAFRLTGLIRYSSSNSGQFGRTVAVDLSAPVAGPFKVTIQGENDGAIRALVNKRFGFRARFAPRPFAHGKVAIGAVRSIVLPAYLMCPRLPGVPRELSVTVTFRWAPAFAIAEPRLRRTSYQFSRRPPLRVSRWGRVNSIRRILGDQ